MSGAKESRPALNRLLADCRKRRVDALVVYRYDRFARSLRQLVNALEVGILGAGQFPVSRLYVQLKPGSVNISPFAGTYPA